jgi:hypothetical protein
MNYSVEFWDSYNKVENNLLFHLRGLKDFIYLIKEISKSFSLFSLSIKKLQEIKLNITTNESLSQGIDNFLQNLFYHYTSLEQFISKMNTEIISPLNAFQETTLKKLNNNYKETLDTEKNYEAYLTQIDFTKNKFHSRIKQLKDKMLEYEIAKSKNENKKIIQKLEEEIKENIGYTKESEKIYLSYIKYTNRIQDEYIEIKKKNLNEIQNMEIDLGENIKSSLMKYYSYQKTYLNNILNDTEQKEKDIDKINIINDINIFINNNSTNDLPPYPIEYMPYIEKNEQITNEKNNNLKNDKLKEINDKVKNDLEKLFPEEKDISSLRTKIDKEIENFLELILEGVNENAISANEKNMKIVSNKNFRRIFLTYLNKLRTNTNLSLNDSSYKIIGNLLYESLIYSYKEKDFVCIKLIIEISTNLFKLNKVSTNPRVFLYEYLKNNFLWKDIKFWENLIKYDINEEMHNQKKYYLYSQENELLKNLRIKDIIKSQVSTNLYNMNLFEIDSSLMFKIINYFSNYYELKSSAIDFLNNIVKNYQIELKEKTNKIKITINNKSNENSKSYIFEKKENREYLENKPNNERKEMEQKTTIMPVKKDVQIINVFFNNTDPRNFENNNKNEKERNKIIEKNNLDNHNNHNIYENDGNKNNQRGKNSNNIILNENNFGNILIKESKEMSEIESDDNIIDESEINYISNCD